MYPTSLALLSLAVLTAVAPVAARADDPIDLEHACALARAGWAMGSYNAELLNRWGCTSGTHSAYCPHMGVTIARGVTYRDTEPVLTD